MKSRLENLGHRILCACMAMVFSFSAVVLPGTASAQSLPLSLAELPIPGTMVGRTPQYQPLTIKGIRIHPDNPLKFNFIMDTGDSQLEGPALRSEADRLVKYFLASLTMPENEMWVNLSPYEKDRIITESFGKTEMGRDLLAQDYILKQLTASLMYPEEQLGGEFWDRVRKKMLHKYGTTDIPVNTFNKVWIVPDKAVIYQHEASAFVVQSHLKVMLEQDYLALDHHIKTPEQTLAIKVDVDGKSLEKSNKVASEMVREILIPEIEREVNFGENFTTLRQIYQGMILSSWFKDNLKETLLGKVYMNQVKTRGIETGDEEVNQRIYEQYLQAFEIGVYNYIKEEYDPDTEEMIPRKYFSGGITTMNVGNVRRDFATLPLTERDQILREARRVNPRAQVVDVEVDLLGLGGKAGDLVIDKVLQAGERGLPIILPELKNQTEGTSDRAILSNLEKKHAMRNYRISVDSILAGDVENVEDLELVATEINEAAAKGDYKEVQDLLDYMAFGEFADSTKEFARQESEQVAQILRGEVPVEVATESAQGLRSAADRYVLSLDWKRGVSAEEQVILNQINSVLLREDNLEKVRTLLNRLRNVPTLSNPRQTQVTQEIARLNLFIFNRTLRKRPQAKPVTFAESNYSKLGKAIVAAQTSMGLDKLIAAGNYRGALEKILSTNLRTFANVRELSGLAGYLMEQDFAARLFDLQRGFLFQLQQEMADQGKPLTLRDIVGNGRLLGFDETPEVIALLSEYLNLSNPQRPTHVTLSRLAQGYTFPELRTGDMDENLRRQRNRILIEDLFRLKILPLIGDMVELEIMDEQSAQAREVEWMEMLTREDVVGLIQEVDDEEKGKVNTETVDILFDKIVVLTRADVPSIMTRLVELGIIRRDNPEQPNGASERQQLNNFFYDVRGELSSSDRALGRAKPETQTQDLTIQDKDGDEYTVVAVRSKTWASMRRIYPRLDTIREAMTRVMEYPDRDTKYRQNFPGVLRVRRGTERLFLRVFEEEKTIVILAYGQASIFKKNESSGDLSSEANKYFDSVSAKNVSNYRDLMSLHAMVPVQVDAAVLAESVAPETPRRDLSVLPESQRREVGGIDLNPALLDLQIRRDVNGVPLPLPQQPVDNIHIQGLVPIIIQITPVNSLPLLMGLADTEQPINAAQGSAEQPGELQALQEDDGPQQVSLLR